MSPAVVKLSFVVDANEDCQVEILSQEMIMALNTLLITFFGMLERGQNVTIAYPARLVLIMMYGTHLTV